MIRIVGQERVLSCDADGCDSRSSRVVNPKRVTANIPPAKGWMFLRDGSHLCPGHLPPRGVKFVRRTK